MSNWLEWIQDQVAAAIVALERIAAAAERIATELERQADE